MRKCDDEMTEITYIDPNKGPTLLKSFDNQPNWCKTEKSVDEFGEFTLGQLVLDLNNTLARIVHISIGGSFRIALINDSGNEFSEATAWDYNLKPYKWKEQQKIEMPQKQLDASDISLPEIMFEKYKEYRDSDIFEGFDIPEVLHFMYFCKHGNMHGKTLNDFKKQ